MVLVFGTFDGFHEGHRYFLNEARKFGDRLVVVVSQDETVTVFKKRSPQFLLRERMLFVESSGLADEVVEGDEVRGSWEVLVRYKPNVIAVGYDQVALRAVLEKIAPALPFQFELKTVGKYSLVIARHKPKQSV